MKTWQTVSILALSAAIASLGWLVSSPRKDAVPANGKPFVARKAKAKHSTRTEQRVRTGGVPDAARRADKFAFAETGEESLKLSFGDDFGFEDEINEKLSSVLQEIYDQYLVASNREDRKAMLSAIQRLLAKASAGEALPVWLKTKMIEGIKWVGGDALPEVIAMAADADADIASSSLEALQEILWDFDTTPQQIADALCEVVKLSTDASVIEPFVFEMNDMSTSLKVSTALMVFDSGNAVATQCLTDNMDFIFDDFDGTMKTREDVVRYGEEHTDDGTDATVTAGKDD